MGWTKYDNAANLICKFVVLIIVLSLFDMIHFVLIMVFRHLKLFDITEFRVTICAVL